MAEAAQDAVAPLHDPGFAPLPFLGLAPFLRLSIGGGDMAALSRECVALAERFPDDANQWMNLATAMFCLGRADVGTAAQAQALGMQRHFHLPAAQQPAKLRLTLLVVPGDLSANTPLDCLLEDSDVDLDIVYVAEDAPIPESLPMHDALMIGIGDADAYRPLLAALAQALADGSRPVINAPANIPNTARDRESELLADLPGVLMPPTLRLARETLRDIAAGNRRWSEVRTGLDFPVIARPLDSQGGHGLARLTNADDLTAYLAAQPENEFFVAPFVDYRSADGQYRKMRIAFVDGVPFPCHMGVSSHWMIHYLNAGMYENADKRADEAAFMDGFAQFARRHAAALAGIVDRIGLDYLCIDCAETPDGRLLVFEGDHVMVVHAMDPVEQFPYKQAHIAKVKAAFRDMILRLAKR